jgi:ferrous iron transport protein B
MFNQLTGMGVITANYPGKTVEVNLATTEFENKRIGIIDLPGTYALGAISEDQWVARQVVLEGEPNVVILIVDATNLTRNLYMVLQFLDLGFPIVIALNLVDQAERFGIYSDAKLLSRLLGVPVVPTVATRGKGLDHLMKTAIETAKTVDKPRPLRYGRDIEHLVGQLETAIMELFARTKNTQLVKTSRDPSKQRQERERAKEGTSFLTEEEPIDSGMKFKLPFDLSPRAAAILLFERDRQFIELIKEKPYGEEILTIADKLSKQLEQQHGEPAPIRIAQERYGLAGTIAAKVQRKERQEITLAEKLWRLTTAPLTGILFLIVALGFIFFFLFYVGELLSVSFSSLWQMYASPIINYALKFIAGSGIIAKILKWGFDAGIEAALSVGIPYVLTFYLLLALMEDSGYLNSVAFLSDRVMHRFGLHGRAVIPLVAGAGCNVPAIIGTRVLSTLRERIIASTLITLVPCSARTAVIIGAVSLLIGWKQALAVYILVALTTMLVGLGLNKVMPGKSTGLVMEMFPLRIPALKEVAKKTWRRFKDFVFVATPIVLIGSLVLGTLYETGLVWKLAYPLSPIIEGWLGLPAVAGLTLIFAILRKELALQLLVTLAIVKYGHEAANILKFMTPNQIFVYALVNTIYIPCVATIAILARELTWKRALAISAFTISLATLIGGLVMKILLIFS